MDHHSIKTGTAPTPHNDNLSDTSSQQSEDAPPPRWLQCWYILSWSFSIITYIAEGFAIVWVAINYTTFELYPNLAFTLGCYFVASFVNEFISLFWYYDLDRVSIRQLEASGPFPGTYKRKCTFSAIIGHCLLLGEVYRYGELIVRVILGGSTGTVKALQRDATLLRFFHGFIVTAPQIIIHLYTITVATDSTHPDTDDYRVTTQVIFVLCVFIISLAYSISAFVTSDRLNSKTRRVILPAHLTLLGWYTCIVVSRILALTLFTHAYGYYVLVVLFFHWVLSVIGILNQKGQFCVDYGQEPHKRRWGLEIPFSLFAACLYQFVYFSLKEGQTRYAVSVYTVVTLIENAIMVALFFSKFNTLWYAPASVAMVVGLFILGVVLLVVYYLVLHPDKTEDWYWFGFPHKCCTYAHKGKSYRPHNIEISEPTLVNMNGQATDLQSRMSGLQPLTGILSRNRSTGQMQLTAPPQVIDSGLPRQDNDFYKKPRIHPPPIRFSSSSQSQSSPYHLQSNNHILPISHIQGPSSNISSEPPSTNELTRVQLLTIPTDVSLGSSEQGDSENIDIQQTRAIEHEPLPHIESYAQMYSHRNDSLYMDDDENQFHSLSFEVVPNPRANANSSNANGPSHDIDIDSPLVSPYDTLEKTQKEVVTLNETETILEENEVAEEEDRMSESPPNLPTPDFTDNILLPGEPSQPYDHLRPSEDLHDNIHHQLHEEQHQQAAVHPPPLKMTPHQKIPLPPAVTPKRPAQNSSATPQAQQLGMFQDIPAKQDYQTQTSKLERHYFPETASSSAPNLSEGAKTGGGGHEESDGAPQNSGVNSVPQPPQSQNMSSNVPNQKDQKSFLPPSPLKGGRQTFPRGAKPLNFSPEQSRGGQSQRGSRGGRGRGKGGGNWNMAKERKISQPVSYYAYTNSSTKTNIGRPHSFNTPKVNPENRQNLFGRTLPVGGVAPGNRAMPFSWQQRGGTMPVHIVSPPPIQKQNWSPDRSRPSGEFQTRGKKLERPRSYSEGIMLESNSPSQERRKSNPSGPPESQNIGPQYSQYYLGRSPGAPRRDQQNYFPQNDRTQTLNLTWTSPRLHHDPAISGQAQPRPKMSFDFGSYSNASSNSRPKPPNLTERSKTAHELGFYGNSPQTNRNKANVPLGARKLSTNQSPGRSLHIPAQGGQSSRV